MRRNRPSPSRSKDPIKAYQSFRHRLDELANIEGRRKRVDAAAFFVILVLIYAAGDVLSFSWPGSVVCAVLSALSYLGLRRYTGGNWPPKE